MTRLSSPESALKKISDIYTQIESFYETIDLIKKFKDKFTTSYEQASEHENQLKIHVAEFENIKKIYNKTVENLKHLCIFLENMLQQTAGEFVYEKTEIRAALERFAADSRIIQNHHLSLDRKLNNTIRNITADMAYMIYNHEAAVNNQLLKTSRITDLSLKAVQNQSDTLALAGQEIKEEIYELEHEINFFLTQAAFRLKKRFTGFDKLRHLYKDAVQRLLEIENRSEKDFLLILNEFIYEKQGLRNLISETVQERIKTRNQNNDLKNNINNALKELENQTAYLANQLKQSGLDNRLQVAQSTDQAKYEISQKLDHLSFESMKFNEQFGELEDDLKAFQSRIKAKLDRNIKILNQKNQSFLQSSDHKAQDRFYKAEKNLKNQIDIEIQKMMSELKNEKDKINSSIAFLNTQKIEIDEHLKNLNTTRENIDFASETAVYRLEAVRTQSEKELKRIILEFEQEKKGVQDTLLSFEKEKQENRKQNQLIDYKISSELNNITTQMAYISDQSDKALADLHILGSQTLDQVQEKTLEKLDQLTLMSDEFKEKFGFLEQDQTDFLSRINAKINLKTKDMDNQLSLWFQDFNRLEQLFQESITRSDKITGILDFEHGRILTEFEQEKAGLRSLAEEFASKYRQLEEKHYMRDREISESVKDMSTHMAYISEQAQKVFQDTWNQAARVSDEEKYRIKKELDRLTLTIDEFKEKFHELEDDLHTSQTMIKAKLERKVGFFSKGLKELLGKAHQEIAKLSEKSCKEQVTSFIEEQKKELPDFEKQLKDFEKQIWENQENFQKKAGQAIVKKLLQESSHIKQEFDKKLEQEIAALKQEQENSDTDQKKREADIRSVLQKIYQGQKKHTAALVKMEKQINILGSRSQPQKKPD